MCKVLSYIAAIRVPQVIVRVIVRPAHLINVVRCCRQRNVRLNRRSDLAERECFECDNDIVGQYRRQNYILPSTVQCKPIQCSMRTVGYLNIHARSIRIWAAAQLKPKRI